VPVTDSDEDRRWLEARRFAGGRNGVRIPRENQPIVEECTRPACTSCLTLRSGLLTRPNVSHLRCGGALVGLNPRHQACDPFAAEDRAFCPDPVCIGVAGGDLRTSPKEAFGRAFEESLHEIGCKSHIDAGLLHPADVLPLGSPSFPISLLKTSALATVYENVAPRAWSSPNFLHSESQAKTVPARPDIQYSDDKQTAQRRIWRTLLMLSSLG
jgi:hypothetical protein